MIRDMYNLHTHTLYCDGGYTPEEMLKAAIRKGCSALGFSGHSYMMFDEGCCMSQGKTVLYEREVKRLKDEYADVIDVFLGIEQDYYSEMPTEQYDYVIGSVHYIQKDGEYICVDAGAENQKMVVEAYYGGDYIAFAEAYYEVVSTVAEKTAADIIGHFDLVTKYNGKKVLFDPDDSRYQKAAIEAMERILEKQKLFEVNTGAMYNHGRIEPYPSIHLLQQLQRRGGEVILSSDSHDMDSICYRFQEMAVMLSECGFKHIKKLTKEGFKDIKL